MTSLAQQFNTPPPVPKEEDWRGTPMKVGDIVVHTPARTGGHPQEGIIEKIHPKNVTYRIHKRHLRGVSWERGLVVAPRDRVTVIVQDPDQQEKDNYGK